MIVLDRDGSLIQSDLAANRPNAVMAGLQTRVVQRDAFERLRCYFLDVFELRIHRWPIHATLVSVATVLLLAGACGPATPQIIVNGDFETGTLTGWLTQVNGAGGWYVYTNGSTSPNPTASDPNVPFQVPNPPQGTFAAVTDMHGPGFRVPYQDLNLDRRYHLRCTIFYRNGAAAFNSPDTFQFTDSGQGQQQFRIDVIKPTAALDSVAEGDVLATVFRTETAGDAPRNLDPQTITFDLSPWAGQTVRLRFAQVDNMGPLRVGVDDVRLDPTE